MPSPSEKKQQDELRAMALGVAAGTTSNAVFFEAMARFVAEYLQGVGLSKLSIRCWSGCVREWNAQATRELNSAGMYDRLLRLRFLLEELRNKSGAFRYRDHGKGASDGKSKPEFSQIIDNYYFEPQAAARSSQLQKDRTEKYARLVDEMRSQSTPTAHESASIADILGASMKKPESPPSA